VQGSNDSRLTWREVGLHAFLALLVVVCLFPTVFLRGDVALPGYFIYESDPWQQYQPPGYEPVKNFNCAESLITFFTWSWIFVEAIEHGEWPLWNAHEMTGLPLHANYQSVVFYPARIFFVLFDLYTAATLFILAKIWICGMTAYVCGRGMGLTRASARFLSFGWMVSGFCMNWLQWPLTDVAAWLPMAFLGVERLLQNRYVKGFFALSLGATLMLLGGHPESAFAMGAGLGMYFFMRLAIDRRWERAVANKIGLAGLAWFVALLVSAIIVIPFVEYCMNSYTMAARHAGDERTQFMRPLALISLWIQRFIGFNGDGTFWGAQNQHENSQFTGLLYGGIVAWVGIAALFTKRSANSPLASRALCLAAPAILGVLLAVEFPTLQFYRVIPFLGSMWGVHHVAFAMFAVPLLGALGMDNWFQQPRRPRELLRVAMPIAVIIIICAGFYLFYASFFRIAKLEGYIAFQYARAFGALGIAFVIVALHCFVRKPVVLANLLAVALCVDLLIATRNQLPVCPREHMYPDTQLTQWLQAQPKPCRVDSISVKDIRPNAMVPYGIEELWGYDGIYPNRIMEVLHQASREGVWSQLEPLLAVDYYIFPTGEDSLAANLERFELVTTLDKLDVVKDRRAYPRTFFLREVQTAPDAAALFSMMEAPGFDSRVTGLTDQPPTRELPKASTTALGDARVVSRTTTKVTVEGEALEDCVLFLSEAFYPGWRAYVDGNEVEVFPLYHGFRGIVFPKGKHIVDYHYRPRSFYAGLGISTLSLLITSFIALLLLRKRAPGATRATAG